IRITFSNPPINIINVDFLEDIHEFLTALRSMTESDKSKIVVFLPSDPKIWLSYLDLHLINRKFPAPSETDSPAAVHKLGEVLHMLNTIPTILLAEVNGPAVGGGNEFVVNMDLRFAGPDAGFGVPEVAGGVLIGPAKTLEYNISTQSIGAREAEKIGLLNKAFDSAGKLRE
ncbi:ClpP/crotonase, partial [Tothia fuscella]